MKMLSRKVKGFTIVEMVTVIAIIGVLLGVLAPAMSTYYWKSRVKSANADAKMIYNAAQTEVQKYIAYDRVHTDASGLKNTMLISYTNQSRGNFRYVTAEDGVSALSTGTPIAVSASHTAPAEAAAASITDAVSKTVSGADTKCWAVYINNYMVKACIAADVETTSYVGYYTTGRITVPDNRPSVTYSSRLTGSSTDADSLIGVSKKYDSATT